MAKVFVYGTLKRGNPNHHVLVNELNGLANFVCNAITKEKYPLVVASCANIPFLLNAKGIGHHVCGEVYEVDEKMKETLDRLENVGVFYDISRIPVITEFDHVDIMPCYVLNSFHDYLLKSTMLPSYTQLESQSYLPGSKRQHITLREIIQQVKQV